MNLFDTNVLLDIATADPTWLPWSETQFRTAAAQGPILINPIIYTELAPAFASAAALDKWVDPAVFLRLPLPYTAGWLAAQAFLRYRRSGGTKTSPLPDFYIGAHAEAEGLTLATRDAARYRTYFPNVKLITRSGEHQYIECNSWSHRSRSKRASAPSAKLCARGIAKLADRAHELDGPWRIPGDHRAAQRGPTAATEFHARSLL